MTVEEKLLELAKKLVAKTDSGTAVWEESGEPEKYITSFPHYSVAIERASIQDNWGNDEHGHTVSLIDKGGKTVEQLYVQEGERRNPLEELHKRARRQAHGVDQALDEILSALG